ncbi:MAG: hypothetical protein DMG24_04075 [Acidobacteria bacterium]|nr:MAG: hypothetical protein DMG24_04075 [Acidobacteriota bacterium]
MKSWCGLFLLSSGLLISASVGRGQTLPAFGHVVIVPLENNAYSSVVSSPSMPYLNSLISQYGLATQYFANTHPSIGNYFMLTTGQILTNDDSQTPSSFPVSVDNIAHQIEVAGKTWRDYPETSGSYIVRHDPLQYFTNINSAWLMDFNQFKIDLANHALPNFSFITPNGCNDAHDCGLDVADSWLQTNIDPLVKSTYFQPGGDGLLIIVFDEDDGSENNRVACVIISPLIVSAGFQSSNTYHHENTLRLMAGALGLTTFPGAAASAATMSEFFHAVSTATPTASLSLTSLSFGNQNVGTTSAAQAVTLSVAGAALTISSLAITAANSGDFAQTNNCGSSVAAGATCKISLTFTPSASGSRSATLSITDNASGSPQTVGLSGTGTTATAPTASLSPTSLSFGNQNVGSTSTAQAVTLSVAGAALTISSLAITGANSGDFAQTNNCGSSVAAGATCKINLTFTPSASGSRSATLSITDNASGSPQTVGLSGTGATAATPTASLSPTSLSFGNQNVGSTSAAQAVTLSVAGAALTISSLAITGANSGDFAQTNNCGSSVAAGATCKISVAFTPSASGSRSATLSITDNASGTPQTVGLSGTGTTASTPAVSLSPASLSFGNQDVRTTSAAQLITLTNSGNASLTISSLTISGDFAFVGTGTCGSTVAAGANCTMSVDFAPKAAGPGKGAVTITDNASGSPHTVPLAGNGVDFSISVPSGSSTLTSVVAGQTASYTLSLQAIDGFSGTVALACVGAPQGATCSVSPGSAALSSSTQMSAKVAVATAGQAIVPPALLLAPPSVGGAMWMPGLLCLLALGIWARARLQGRSRVSWGFVAALLSVLLWSSCGAGGFQALPRTPAGSYTMTVTGTSGALTHSVKLGLTVNQ